MHKTALTLGRFNIGDPNHSQNSSTIDFTDLVTRLKAMEFDVDSDSARVDS